jgi:hypothetical protein
MSQNEELNFNTIRNITNVIINHTGIMQQESTNHILSINMNQSSDFHDLFLPIDRKLGRWVAFVIAL